MLPLLLIVLFAIIDFGRMVNWQLKVTEAAREGARAYSFGETPDGRVSTVMGGLTDVTITPNAGCAGLPAPSADAVVTVSYQFQFITPFAALAGMVVGPQTLSATGVMPCRG
jgi:hypothetical protein